MFAVGLALVSALAYGISDFLGGIFARSISPWRVAATGQIASTICVVAVAGFVSGQATSTDFAWSLLAGLGGGTGAAFLYRGLASAKMNVVAPISGVGCAILPVTVGLAMGERPELLAAIGIATAFPAIWLISRGDDDDPTRRSGIVDGVLAGLGFGLLFTAIAQVRPEAGLWPVASMYIASTISVSTIALLLGHSLVPRRRSDLKPLILGLIGAPAALAFFEATHHGMLSVVSVITALFPAATVLLAFLVLHERVRFHQAVGLAMAAVAVGLVAAG